MNATLNDSIGKIVSEDFRTAAVFQKYGIDFCCKGNLTIAEVCAKKNLEADSVLRGVNAVLALQSATNIDFRTWPMDLLTDYIEKKHHRYVNEKTPLLLQYLDKLCKVHGPQHPELFRIAEEFRECAQVLAAHMKKEELVLFPFIKKLECALQTKAPLQAPHFGTVQNPVQMMMHEHDDEGERFRRIAGYSSNYTPPSDACNTYRVAYSMLKEFEEDLHTHIHIENNILFPRAVEAEQSLNNQIQVNLSHA